MRFNIRFKFIIFTFCIVLLVGGSIALYSVYQGRERILETFENDARLGMSSLAAALGDPIHLLDIHALRLRLANARANPRITFIYALDKDGAVVADDSEENPLQGRKFADGFVKKVLSSDRWLSEVEGGLLKVGGPVLMMPDRSKAGYLYVGFALRDVDRFMRETTMGSVYIAAICLGFGAILAFILSTSFSRPILDIVRASGEIGAGKLDTRLAITRSDELGTLAGSINRMADALRKRETEMARAGEELQARYKELEALYEMGQTVLSSPDLKSVLENMLDQVLSIFRLDIGNIRLFKSNGEMLIGAYRGYREPENARMHLMRVYRGGPETGSLVPKVMASKKSLTVEDVQNVEGMRVFKREAVQSGIVVPIFSQEEGLGVIEAGSRSPRRFHPNESRLLETIGNQIGVAVQKAQLFEEVQQQARRQEALNAIAKASSQTLHLDELLQTVSAKVLEVTGRERVSVRLKDPVTGRVTLAAHRGFSQEEIEDLLRRTPHRASEQVFATGEPIVVNSPSESGGDRSLLPQSRSVVWIPIKSGAKVVGVLGVSAGRPIPFVLSEVDFLKAIGNVIGVAIENARLFEGSQRQEEMQKLLKELSQDITSLGIDALFRKITEKAREFLHVDISDIRLLEGGRIRRVVGASGIEPERLLRLGGSRGRSAWIMTNRRALVISDTTKESTIPTGETIGALGIRGYLAVPLFSRSGEVIGILRALTYQPREFSQSEVDLLQQMANGSAIAFANARLFDETKRNLDGIRALHEIDKAITSTLDLHDILAVLLEKIDLFLPYSTATIRLFNKESGLLEPVACRNLDEKEWKLEQWKAGRGPANVVFDTKAPMMIRNCYADPRVRDPDFFHKHRLVSYLGVPMIAREEMLGVLSFYTKEEHEYAGEEVEFLTTLAGQAAIAIHNSRLYEETERRRREAEELARVARSLTESLDMAAVGERVVTSVRQLLGVNSSTLRLVQPEGSLRVLASSGEGFSMTAVGEVLPAGTGLAGAAVAEGKPIWSADVSNDPRIRITDQMRDYQLRIGYCSMIAVPLRAHEKVIGSLGLADRTGRIYSDSQVALLQTFADQAALALENARLYEETRARETQLQESNRMLSALHSLAAAVSQSLDLDLVLKAAVEKIIDMFRFDATGIYIHDDKTNQMLLRVSLASDRERFTQPPSFAQGQGIVGKVVESRQPLIFEDIETDPRYRQFSRSASASQLGHHFFAVFPVKGKLKNVGALTCMGVARRSLNLNEVRLLEAMADQIAVAVENSALYEEMVKLAADLSRSNHVKDEFLSVMSHELRTPLNVVMGYSGMMRDGLLGPINPEQERALEKVISRARDQLTMIGSILQATQMEAEGVKVQRREVELKDFLDDLKSSYSIPLGKAVSLVWDYPSGLPAIHTDDEKLKSVLQNLINNAIKFTEKGSITISAKYLNGAGADGKGAHQAEGNSRDPVLELRVSDTGIGIAKENLSVIFERFRQVDSSETRDYGGVGIGLYIAKKFTELLGGRIDVESGPGKGSTFTVTIPCEDQR